MLPPDAEPRADERPCPPQPGAATAATATAQRKEERKNRPGCIARSSRRTEGLGSEARARGGASPRGSRTSTWGSPSRGRFRPYSVVPHRRRLVRRSRGKETDGVANAGNPEGPEPFDDAHGSASAEWCLSAIPSGEGAAAAETPCPTPESGWAPGRWVSGYVLLEVLGRGGAGTVHRAFDPRLGRQVALKRLDRLPRADEAVLRRFRREGQVAAALRHPAIVAVHDFGWAGAVPFLVYELVPGARPLLEACAHASLGRGVEWLRDAARALGHAHRRGVVHRDVKSENVLVDGDGRVRVTDFGLARATGLDDLTRTGDLVGTPRAMAPEQFSAGEVSPATDVWALGVLLYRLLCGRPPFPASSLLELAEAVRTQSPTPPHAILPRVPPGLEAVCLRALAREPAERYPDGDAFAAALDAWLAGGLPVEADAGRRGRRWGSGRTAAALALLGGAGLVALVAALVAGGSAPASGVAARTPTPPAPSPSADEEAPSPARGTPQRRAGPTKAPDGSPRAKETGAPAWFRALPPAARPPRLPPGVRWGPSPGEYLNERDGSVLVWIPGGTFLMGSRRSRLEAPPHRVSVDGFFLGKYEVTRAQYAAYCRDAGRDSPLDPPYPTSPKHPVVLVSWKDARDYCAWAGLRLPSEAQWEYAARGRDGRRFPWGDAALPDRARVRGDGPLGSQPVGRYPAGASPFGCLDMAGNVYEWVEDGGAYYRAEPAHEPLVDPAPAPARVVRGGSYAQPLSACTTTAREFAAPDTWTPFIGFRVARSP
ncbi:MAG: hypothetical protein D6731_00465 [Planctomycetota bacterium]|nr:MAG: hypothetical protein D6731_00465 [Planctomycetota bacterium]